MYQGELLSNMDLNPNPICLKYSQRAQMAHITSQLCNVTKASSTVSCDGLTALTLYDRMVNILETEQRYTGYRLN